MLEYIDERKQKVLQIIVEDYVDSAEPIGSKAVTEKHCLEASPATIRFDMADLEKKGFIKKPHTSAGRIPSDKGYRFFIDQIMKIEGLAKKDVELIKTRLEKADSENLLETIGGMLSDISGSSSVVITSDKHSNIYVCGISRMLRQPEFNLSEQICDVIETLEQHSSIYRVLNEYIEESSGLSIHVGLENRHKALKKCSVAATPFKERGIISIVGPTRMDYKKVSAVLRHFADYLEETEL
jgi:transcriptional regulator of heat shock response